MGRTRSFAVTPRDMFEKMLLEYASFEKDTKSTRHAINFTLTAYHLREWVWHAYLENDPALRDTISKAIQSESDFNEKMNSDCRELLIIKELANNIKHLLIHTGPQSIEETKEMQTWDQIDCKWEDLDIPWDYDGLIIVTNKNKWTSISDIFEKVKDHWVNYFEKYFSNLP